MAKTHDVVIVGGGVVGAACARELAGAGRTVLVLDPDDRPGPGWRASAGLLAPQIDAHEDNPLYELGIAGREYYHEHAAELAEQGGADIGLFDGGILRIAEGEAEVARLKASVAWQRQHGHRTDWLDPAEVASEYPWVGRTDGALWAARDGSVCAVRLVEALRAGAIRRGATFVKSAATGLLSSAGQVAGVETAQGNHAAGSVVLAAGAWTGRLANLPRPVSVEPVRGQMIAKPWPKGIGPAIIYGTRGYVLERDGEAWCGATTEHAGFSAETTEAGVKQVTEAGARLMPALGQLPTRRAWAGLRPGSPDGLPIVGAEPNSPNLWYATGYGRNGVLLAGITAVALCHLMDREATFEAIDALRPERYWSR